MKRIPRAYHKPECNSGFYTQLKRLRSIVFIDFYLAVDVLWSKGQNETVTLATCFSEAPLMSAILRNLLPGSSLLVSEGFYTRGPWKLVSI